MDIPITQSDLWHALQSDLGETSFFRQESDYQYLAILKHTPVGNYLYAPYGPVATTEKSFQKALASLTSLAKEKAVTFIRIEPRSPETAQYLPHTAHKSKDLNPKDTWVLDLTPDQPTIISNFSQGTRTRYNTYAKKGLTVERTTDPAAITHLVRLQDKLYRTKNLNRFSADYLKSELSQPFATLYLVKYHQPAAASQSAQAPTSSAATSSTSTISSTSTPADGQVLAASLFFDYAGTRYYMQSAADTDFKKLPATVALLTAAIFDAKEQGITKFDFWGIAPDGADHAHPWYGFTEFKKSFGGHPVHYAGTYDIVLKPLRYRLYLALRRFGRFHH